MKLIQFFIIFKLKFQQKKKFFKFPYNIKHVPLIQIFIQFKIIKQIKKENNMWIIWPNTQVDNKAITNLKLLYKPSHKRNISIQTLNKMEGTQYSTIYLILSSKGLITNKLAVKKKTGGILFCRLN